MLIFRPFFPIVLLCIFLIFSASATQKKDKWKWTSEDWTGNNTPYLSLRKNLDTKIENPILCNHLIALYRNKALRSNDALSQFAWAYAAWDKQKTIDKQQEQHELLWPIWKNSLTVESPHTYEYARMQFLIGFRYSPARELKGVGARLLRHSPTDYDVKAIMIKILEPGTPDEWKTALSYAKELIEWQPKNPKSHSLLGGVYFMSWYKKNDPVTGQAAIASYQQYLKLAQPNAEWRPQAKFLIRHIEKRSSLK